MELPVGEVFESLIRWLKANLGELFDAISATINFAILLLERILSVEAGVLFPMLFMTLLIAGLCFGLLSRKLPWKQALAAGVAVMIAGILLHNWRSHRLTQTVTADQLTTLHAGIAQVEDQLAQAPDALRETVDAPSGQRELSRVRTRIERTNAGEALTSVLSLSNYQRSRAFLDRLAMGQGPLAESAATLSASLADLNPAPLSWFSWAVTSLLLILLAWYGAGRGLAIFTLIGCGLIQSMGFWEPTVETLALVISATAFALLIGVPLGIAAAASQIVDRVSKPVLDFMQTMPAFVYLIPAVLFFGLGKVPGAIATLIFAMPPAVRLTSLGIRGVPTEVVEAAQSFGSTPMQLLFKAQLPIALPTILAGLNQTIMLALSMVVIGGMIGAGGLGEVVLSGITQLKIGLGFESGLSVVILAIYLDRLTQSIGSFSEKR